MCLLVACSGEAKSQHPVMCVFACTQQISRLVESFGDKCHVWAAVPGRGTELPDHPVRAVLLCVGGRPVPGAHIQFLPVPPANAAWP